MNQFTGTKHVCERVEHKSLFQSIRLHSPLQPLKSIRVFLLPDTFIDLMNEKLDETEYFKQKC